MVPMSQEHTCRKHVGGDYVPEIRPRLSTQCCTEQLGMLQSQGEIPELLAGKTWGVNPTPNRRSIPL